ncbi:hypothetical protein TL16_g06112 [Triparma laevis f. inornata]|uniref:3'-5' exonuclease n=1 Tax=Triparma laevis f. inornata TaxID=1714386 RepID=A0A9W7ANJ3_9STRA|nr:hypothetical protein TL16_g06112 [Triparma laevis f. inornata]
MSSPPSSYLSTLLFITSAFIYKRLQPRFPTLTNSYLLRTSLHPTPGAGNVKTLLWSHKNTYFITISPPNILILKKKLPKGSKLTEHLKEITGYEPGTLPCFINELMLRLFKTIYIDTSLKGIDLYGGSGDSRYTIKYNVPENVIWLDLITDKKMNKKKKVEIKDLSRRDKKNKEWYKNITRKYTDPGLKIDLNDESILIRVLHNPTSINYLTVINKLKDYPPSIVLKLLNSSDENGKNAIHKNFWKSDHYLALLSLLTHHSLLSLLNLPSTGSGNSGKTPIFYSITQSRLSVVKILVEEGVRLKVVNDKCQTPLSLCISHFDEEFCKWFEEKEKEDGREWINYFEVNPDKSDYGDVDVRFLNHINDPTLYYRNGVASRHKEGKICRVIKVTSLESRRKCNRLEFEGDPVEDLRVVKKGKAVISEKVKNKKVAEEYLTLNDIEAKIVTKFNPPKKTLIYGLDCEWPPQTKKSISTLQLSYRSYEGILCVFVTNDFKVLEGLKGVFVGFDLKGDLERLDYKIKEEKVVDLKYGGIGLSGLTKKILGKRLDKTLQCSDWTWPLSEEQIIYAGLDAGVCLRIWEVSCAVSDERWECVDGVELLWGTT